MKRKLHFSVLTAKLLLGAITFGVLMCVLNSIVSYREFKKQVESLYSTVTSQFAETAISYIDADRIFLWLTEGSDGLWDSTNARLNELTESAELAFIYLTVVAPDYKSRTYVFDTVHSSVLSSPYALGYVESLEKKTPDYIEDLKNIIENKKKHSYFSYKKGGGHVTTSIPVRDFMGNVIAVLSVVKPMTEIAAYKANYLHAILIAALAFTTVFVGLYMFSLLKRIIRPLMLIIHETSHFAEQHAEFSDALKNIKNRDELGLLAKSVEKMASDMHRYIKDLTHATAEKERLSTELNVAKQIQAEMLPRVFPPYDAHPEIELFATMDPAKEVGGDFYDFYMLDDDHFAVVVGDVSGKGVPAALFMVIAKTLLKDAAYQFKNPAEIFNHVNNVLCETNESGLFVTCWLGILELSTGKFQFSNAGHTPPVLYHDGSASYLTTKPNLMLAAMDGIKYTTHEITFSVGDRIFIYTDGITEATNSKNELYGEERLITSLMSTKGQDSRNILSSVRKDIDRFVDGAPQFDDITMLDLGLLAKHREEISK